MAEQRDVLRCKLCCPRTSGQRYQKCNQQSPSNLSRILHVIFPDEPPMFPEHQLKSAPRGRYRQHPLESMFATLEVGVSRNPALFHLRRADFSLKSRQFIADENVFLNPSRQRLAWQQRRNFKIQFGADAAKCIGLGRRDDTVRRERSRASKQQLSPG